MSFPEFERMLGAVLPSPGRTSLTLTEAPQEAGLLASMLERANVIGQRQSTRLREVQLPRHLLRSVGAKFNRAPLSDSGDVGVVRLTFEA